MFVATIGLLYGRLSYEFQHAQDVWFESDFCLELLAAYDAHRWGGLVAADC